MNLPIEAVEASLPIRFVAYELVPQSGGAGLHKGGAGVRKCIEFLTDGIEASVLGERTFSRAHGVSGGEEGSCARFTYRSSGGNAVVLEAKSGPHKFSAGDQLDMLTAGGGGWGTKTMQKAAKGEI
jgi:N-methylhydantoinase B